MASSKSLLFLFVLLFALVLLISSDATAADQESVKTTGVSDASSGEVKQGYHCRYRCCRWYQGRCMRCCGTAEETPETKLGDEDASSGEVKQGYNCRYRCCRWYQGRCMRCCGTAEETPQAESGDEVKN